MFEILEIMWALFYPIITLILVAYGFVVVLLYMWNKEQVPPLKRKEHNGNTDTTKR